MADCTTVFETLTGFLPMNILEKAVDQPTRNMELRSLLFLGNLIR